MLSCFALHLYYKQETHHEMRIPKRDVTHIVLSVYLLTLTSFIGHKMDHTQVNLLHLKTFEVVFAEYLQYTDVRIADLCWTPYHLPGKVISVAVALSIPAALI